MPRTQIEKDQAFDPDFLSPDEHTQIGDGSPHHARGHTIASTSDHDVSGTPADGQVLVWSSSAGKWVPQAISLASFLIASWGGLVYDNAGELVLK